MIHFNKSLLTAAFALLSTFGLAQNPGDLVVTPTRLELGDQMRSGEITLINRTNETLRYRLSFVDMEMSDLGVLRRLALAPATSALGMLKIAPREVILGAGEAQNVKILITFPAGAPEGEYRSHLSFECLSRPKEIPAAASDVNGIQIGLRLRTLVTIPIIARHGHLSATATISEPTLTKESSSWAATFRLTRGGTRSLRGDVTAVFVPQNGTAGITLGRIAGLPVYSPNRFRIVSLHLAKDPNSLGKGRLDLQFTEPGTQKSAVTVMASIPLGS